MATGIVKFPAASGLWRWESTTIEPPKAVANCTPSQRSAGQVVVADAGIASRLNQYVQGWPTSSAGIDPVAWTIIGWPTTGVADAERESVKPSASAGAARAARTSGAAGGAAP